MKKPIPEKRARPQPLIPLSSVQSSAGALGVPRLWNRYQVEAVSIDDLRTPSRQLRRHAERQIVKLSAGIERFGFNVPPLATIEGELITGVARVEAARRLGLKVVPVIRITDLSPEEIRAFRIADNRLAELAQWDDEQIAIELKDLSELKLDFSLELTAFETAEIDLRIGSLSPVPADDPADEQIEPPAVPVTQPGDLWILGSHRISCGNALEALTYEGLMQRELARMVVADCPFNVKIDGHVGGLGKVHHKPFAMAVGEMSEEQFTKFLATVLVLSRRHLIDGGIAFYFMDWRHLHEMTTAQREADFTLINLCVWAKTNGGMGSLYRSRHELAFVFKKGREPHVNAVQLGRYGRYRTNVWDYAGANSFRKGRDQDLADHPTCKSVEMIADAIRDVSHRGDIVVDPFVGSGTTILAAERTGRRARAIEIDPGYVDVCIRRWQAMTGQEAILAASGEVFSQVSRRRSTPGLESSHQAEMPRRYRVRHRSNPIQPVQQSGG